MDIFGDLERFASDLYPYRWAISIGTALAAVAVVLVAVRQGWFRVVARNPLRSVMVAVPVVALLVGGGWYGLSPLWERSYLEEASPLAAADIPALAASATATTSATLPSTVSAGDPADAAATPVPPKNTSELANALPRLASSGMFAGTDDFHFGRGTVQVIETTTGKYTLRFEGFSVRNGPDLFVYLTPDASGRSIEGAINLGKLKATDGAFNYDVPPGTDISQFASAVVWCRQFAVLFAVAELGDV